VAPVTGYSRRCTNISIYVTSLGEAGEYYWDLIQNLLYPQQPIWRVFSRSNRHSTKAPHFLCMVSEKHNIARSDVERSYCYNSSLRMLYESVNCINCLSLGSYGTLELL
jgi:hypothetical protein